MIWHTRLQATFIACAHAQELYDIKAVLGCLAESEMYLKGKPSFIAETDQNSAAQPPVRRCSLSIATTWTRGNVHGNKGLGDSRDNGTGIMASAIVGMHMRDAGGHYVTSFLGGKSTTT